MKSLIICTYWRVKKDNRAAVDRAHCSCIGGCGGHCNHTFALLFLLNDYSSSKIKGIPSDSTCTSNPQTWHIPRGQSICPLPVMATHYVRAVTDMDGGRKRNSVTCKLYDARSNFARKSLPAPIQEQVTVLKNRDKSPPFSYLLADQKNSVIYNIWQCTWGITSVISTSGHW